MKFFKTVLAVIVGCFTSLFLLLLIFIGMASFFAPKEDALEIKDMSIATLYTSRISTMTSARIIP